MKIFSKTVLLLFLVSVLFYGCKKDDFTSPPGTEDFQFSVNADQLTHSDFKAIIVSNFDGRIIHEKIITDTDRSDGLDIVFKKAENDIVCVSFLAEGREDSYSGSTYYNIQNGTAFDYTPNPTRITETVRLEIEGLDESASYDYQLGGINSEDLNPVWKNTILQLNTNRYLKEDEIFFTIKDSLSGDYKYFSTSNTDTLYKINFQNLPILNKEDITKIGVNLSANTFSNIEITGYQNQSKTSIPFTLERTMEGDSFLIFAPPNMVFDEYLISVNNNRLPLYIQLFDKKFNTLPAFMDLSCDIDNRATVLPFYKFEDQFITPPQYFAIEKIRVFGSYSWNISGFHMNDFQFQIPKVSDEIIAIAPAFKALERNANTTSDQLSNLTFQYHFTEQQLEDLKLNPLLTQNKEWYLKDGRNLCLKED